MYGKTFISFLLLSVILTYGTSEMRACINRTGKKFYVESYGARGDGKTNAIAAFQALARDVNANGGGIVVFPKDQVYSISIENDYSCGHKSRPDDGAMAFNFEHCSKVVVDMNGSTILLTPNHSTKYSFFRFFDCSSFKLSNGTIVGDVVHHDYSPVIYKNKEEKTSHQWGYGVFVYGSKGEIENMKITRMTGDGIYTTSIKIEEGLFHARTTIRNSEISYCRRNGIGCASSLGFFLYDTKIHHVGDWEKTDEMPVAMTGCRPKAGIDFEYEGRAGDVGDVEIANCSFADCTDYCIVTSNTSRPETTNFNVTGTRFSGSVVHTNNLTSRGKKDFSDCRFDNSSAFLGDANVYRCVFEMGVVIHYISRTSFYDCIFNGHLENLDAKHGCFMAGTNMEQTTFTRCSFKNIKGYNDDTPAFQGFSGYVHPVNAVFRSCDFDNCSFVISQKNYESRLSFDKCRLTNGCLIHNMGTEAISFNDSELVDVDSYVTQNGKFVLENCTVIQVNEKISHPFVAFGNHQMKNCVVRDRVGITNSAVRSCGVREYRIEATDTKFELDNPRKVTKGIRMKRGSLTGVSARDFQGSQENTRFH